MLNNKSGANPKREMRYKITQLSSGEKKVVAYYVKTKNDASPSPEESAKSDNTRSNTSSTSQVQYDEMVDFIESTTSKFRTKLDCFKSFKRTLKRYNHLIKNHAFPRLQSGYVYYLTLTLAEPLNSLYEFQNICKRFESSIRRCKFFKDTNFKYVHFIENSTQNVVRGLLQPHVHYLLIGDIELCLDDKEVSALLLKKWLTLEKRTGVMHKFTRIRARKDLNKTVDYLTDYASSKDNAVKKNASLQGMPYDFNPISCSRELEKPSELRCDFNPYENEVPTFRTSSSNPFYEEYIEYDK